MVRSYLVLYVGNGGVAEELEHLGHKVLLKKITIKTNGDTL